MKSKAATKEGIVTALERVLVREGFSGVGVNAVAREAGVDKVLIYRYFGGMEGLVRALSERSDFWPSLEDLLGGAPDELLPGMALREASIRILQGYLREIRRRPVTQQILRWELVERNAITDILAETREEQGMSQLSLIATHIPIPSGLDIPALAATLHAAIMYLILRSGTARYYQGVDLHAEEGWRRIGDSIESMVNACFDRFEEADRASERAAE
jgi:AcrR family transcriptional regulator